MSRTLPRGPWPAVTPQAWHRQFPRGGPPPGWGGRRSPQPGVDTARLDARAVSMDSGARLVRLHLKSAPWGLCDSGQVTHPVGAAVVSSVSRG